MLVAMKLMAEEDCDADVWVRVMTVAQGIKVEIVCYTAVKGFI